MGRLFWKFFIFIWLIQLAGIVGTGALFWLERQQREAHFAAHLKGELPWPPPPTPHGPPAHAHSPLPVIPMLVGLLASLLSAAGLAWYVAKPIRRLRQAFEAAAEGDLSAMIGEGMGRRRDELVDLGRDFDRMAARLRLLMEGQKRLLHDVSHELRSPLARLQAALGLLQQQPARLADSLQRIEREIERMNFLVGELLTLSRLEAGVSGVVEVVDLGELLEGLLEDTRFEASARHVAVDASSLPELSVRANGELLHRAIENVLRNALRYSPEGESVRLEVSQPDAAHCRITVLDRGPGVALEHLGDIFTPFFRAAGQGEGYGLGLAIAQRVLTMVGGEIRASNRPQGGLAVDIDLPVVLD